ncbi:MAG: PHP domain-containing protein [Pseudomonadota bacterium]
MIQPTRRTAGRILVQSRNRLALRILCLMEQQPRVDFHCHTSASDGSLTPQQLLNRAIEAGLDMLAITDHDTIEGYRQLADKQVTKLQLVSGIELSAVWKTRGVHIVGLDFDPANDELVALIKKQQESRQRRAVRIAGKLEKLGIRNALQGATKIARDAPLSRVHFAKFLVETETVKTIKTAFSRYLGAGKPGDIRNEWVSMEEAVTCLRAAGGVAVLAHPDAYKLTKTKRRALARDFVAAGGEAIEIISGSQSPELTGQLCALAADLGCAASIGSDFHSDEQAWRKLGRCGYVPGQLTPVWETFKPHRW